MSNPNPLSKLDGAHLVHVRTLGSAKLIKKVNSWQGEAKHPCQTHTITMCPDKVCLYSSVC